MDEDVKIVILLIIIFVVVQAVLFPLRFSVCENLRARGVDRAYYKSIGRNDMCDVGVFLGFRLAGYPHLLHNDVN